MVYNDNTKRYVVTYLSVFMAVWGVLDAAIAMNWAFPRAPNSRYLIEQGIFSANDSY